jgi:hypothetical protein
MRTFRIQSRTPSVFCRAIFPLLLLLALVGCSTGSEGSRHAIYGSLDELVGDTTVIVVATASESQSRRLDGVQVNALTMHVHRQLFPKGLGSDPKDPPSQSFSRSAGSTVGATVDVWQLAGSPVPSIKLGTKYLFFLCPTETAGAADHEFYIVGGVAGMYQDSGNGRFRRLSNGGDKIPEFLSEADLA